MTAGPWQQQQTLNGKDPDLPLLSCPPAPSPGLCGDGLQRLTEYPRDLSRLSLPPALPGYCPAYPGLGFAELSLASSRPLAPWRRNCRAAASSTKPHCSQQTLPGADTFFSNDSAAREWEGPHLRPWHEISLARSWKGGVTGHGVVPPGLEGGARVLGGTRQLEGWAKNLLRAHIDAPSPSPRRAEAMGRKWRWESWSPWRRASSGQPPSCAC